MKPVPSNIQGTIRDKRLLSYLIASSDMRYITVNEREIYIRNQPEIGLIIRGEIPGCGAECFINLSQILFEYAVSCEDCKDHASSLEAEERFGSQLGRAIVSQVSSAIQVLPPYEQLKELMTIVLQSMAATFTVDQEPERMGFVLDESPLHQAAQEPGYQFKIPMAHLGFVALCESIVQKVAPEWRLIEPAQRESSERLKHVYFSHSL